MEKTLQDYEQLRNKLCNCGEGALFAGFHSVDCPYREEIISKGGQK